jgi:hypothetical protein
LNFLPKNGYEEEVELLNAVKFYCTQNPNTKRTRHLVLNAPKEKQITTIELVDKVRASVDMFGLKRFSHKKDDALRLYIKQLINQATNE